jgi:two-component system cell cycle response regulator DivK
MKNMILIVDDDPRSMKLTFDLLTVFGYQTLTASNGEQAVEMAQTHKPDLILMDIQLPVMDGLSATRLIKSDSSTNGIPILAATAYAMAGDEAKAIAAGCDGYITKPIDIRVLLKTVEKYLAGNSDRQIVLNRSGEHGKK